MRKIIAAINMTVDGVCDHTAGLPDEQIHQHYADLLSNADTILYGRTTYQLMEYWRPFVEKPTGNKPADEFAVAIDNISKIVFSRTLKNLDWESATIAKRDLKDEVVSLRQQSGKDILIGSPGLIIQLLKLNLIDEFQLYIYPVVAGSGTLLFENIKDRTLFTLLKTKTFNSGAIILYYKPTTNDQANKQPKQ